MGFEPPTAEESPRLGRARTDGRVALVTGGTGFVGAFLGEELSPAELPMVALRGQLSIENARSQLGWEPRFGSLRDGIAQYVDHYRAFHEASAESS